MGFKVPHEVINRLLPGASNVAPEDWIGFVGRADQLNMDRSGCYEHRDTQCNRFADEYEGTWLKKWVDNSGAQRLHPKEQGMVPLFHQLTRPLEQAEIAKSGFAFAAVPADRIQGEHKGVDLADLAKRIAATDLEAKDGDPLTLQIRAMADAAPAHTPKELEAMNQILWRYFARNVTFGAYENAAAGVSAAFDAVERPYAITREGGAKFKVHTKRELKELVVKAPEGARVSLVPIDKWERMGAVLGQVDIGPGGEGRLDLTNLPENTAKLALCVVHDEDAAGPKAPVAKSRVSLPLPWCEFHWNLDNSERIARLRAWLPEA